MKNVTPFPAAPSPEFVDVIVLNCPHQLHFDSDPMIQLFADKGVHEAEAIVCLMLEDMTLRLDMLQKGLSQKEFMLLERPARRVRTIADRIGMTEVAVSAGHVIQCLQQDDGVALEATMARLERGFDVAVSEIWNFREL